MERLKILKRLIILVHQNLVGQVEVLLNPGEALENVPNSCEEQGYKILSSEPTDDDKHLLLIEK